MADRIVENVITTTQLSQQLPLQTLADSIQNTEYQYEDAVLIFRFDNPKRAVFLTEQGKLSCTGVKSIKQGEKTINQVIEILKKQGISVEDKPEIQLQSFVISINIEIALDIDTLNIKLPSDKIVYQPQQNPWVEFLFDKDVTFLIGLEGIIVCIGKGSIDHANKSIDTLIELLK
jgi:transcription initiation factor TFIID TATA-box-binding protein